MTLYCTIIYQSPCGMCSRIGKFFLRGFGWFFFGLVSFVLFWHFPKVCFFALTLICRLLFIGLHFNSAYAFVRLSVYSVKLLLCICHLFCFLPLSPTSYLCFFFLHSTFLPCSSIFYSFTVFCRFCSSLSFWLSGLIVYDYLDEPIFSLFFVTTLSHNFLAHRPGS